MKKVPLSNQVYISASLSNSIIISGPPSTLRLLVQDSESLETGRFNDQVHGPYHAQHLHDDFDLHHFLQSQNHQIFDHFLLRIPLLLAGSGTMLDRELSARDALVSVVDDILKKPFQLDRFSNSLTTLSKSPTGTRYCLISYGFTAAESDIVAALKSKTSNDVFLQQRRSPIQSMSGADSAPKRSKKTKLAIVGMAGRFPNAADHEKFWQLLEAGVDTHKKVMFWPVKVRRGAALTMR